MVAYAPAHPLLGAMLAILIGCYAGQVACNVATVEATPLQLLASVTACFSSQPNNSPQPNSFQAKSSQPNSSQANNQRKNQQLNKI